jgi:hypothetical protein
MEDKINAWDVSEILPKLAPLSKEKAFMAYIKKIGDDFIPILMGLEVAKDDLQALKAASDQNLLFINTGTKIMHGFFERIIEELNK